MAAQGYELSGKHTTGGGTLPAVRSSRTPRGLNPRFVWQPCCWRSNPSEAEKLLRQVVSPTRPIGRRAACWRRFSAARGGQDAWQEVQQLLSPEAANPVDQRLRALVLARRGGATNLARSP